MLTVSHTVPLAAHAGSSPPPEIALDRPYREAREAFETVPLASQKMSSPWRTRT